MCLFERDRKTVFELGNVFLSFCLINIALCHKYHPLHYCDGEFYVVTRLGHGVPRYLVKHYSGYFCEDVF